METKGHETQFAKPRTMDTRICTLDSLHQTRKDTPNWVYVVRPFLLRIREPRPNQFAFKPVLGSREPIRKSPLTQSVNLVTMVLILFLVLHTGVTLNPKEWAAFRSSFSDIEEAITKMELRMRGEESIGRNQTEAEASNPPSILASEEDRGHTYVSPPHPLVPIATTRFTGKNYYCWKRQMEFFLGQLQVFYVLNDWCPNIPASPEVSFQEISQAKSRAQKWINDDYICRHSILNSLSDQLFDQYSIKTMNARELWDELKSSYADDFGTRISHVNNYIQFQMVDGVSVLEQVQELHRIAGTITTSGIHIDENFHVSAIISKLPPSWKHVRVKLMQEEHLPLDKLIYLLKDEEDCRNQQKRGFKKKDMRGVCFGCHQEGHIRRDCPLTRSYQREG